MELVKIYNNRNEYIDKIKDRKELENGEYRNLVHIWIINSKGELLLQRRSEMKKHFPNMWSVTSGCVHSDESFVQTCKREVKEELNVDLDENNLEYMISYKLEKVIAQVFVLYQDVDINKVRVQEEEVSEVKFVTCEELEEMIKNNMTAGSINYFDFLKRVINKEIK